MSGSNQGFTCTKKHPASFRNALLDYEGDLSDTFCRCDLLYGDRSGSSRVVVVDGSVALDTMWSFLHVRDRELSAPDYSWGSGFVPVLNI